MGTGVGKGDARRNGGTDIPRHQETDDPNMSYPKTFEVDYVRVYLPEESGNKKKIN
jgi:hypothetical protein